MKLKWSVHKDSDYCLCVPNFLSDDEIKHFRTINKDQKFLRAGTRHSGYNPNIRNTWRKHQVSCNICLFIGNTAWKWVCQN